MTENTPKKPHTTQEIIFETDLETKASSPLGNPDQELSLLGLEDG